MSVPFHLHVSASISNSTFDVDSKEVPQGEESTRREVKRNKPTGRRRGGGSRTRCTELGKVYRVAEVHQHRLKDVHGLEEMPEVEIKMGVPNSIIHRFSPRIYTENSHLDSLTPPHIPIEPPLWNTQLREPVAERLRFRISTRPR